jgi:nucleoside-diphosphate-sugar epimerase
MIVITGATGFLGGAMARALSARGQVVRALVRKDSDGTSLDAMGIERVVGDVLATTTLARAFEGASAVIHCAGKLGRAGAVEDEYRRVHVEGTKNVLEAARAAQVPRVVHVSSPGLLGPITGADADEDAPAQPTNVYERAKAGAERAVREFEAVHGLRVVIVRPEFVYGPGDFHVLRLFQAIQRRRFFYIGPGSALCHPTYVDDAVDGILAALEKAPLGRVYHLAGPRPVAIRHLAETIASALGVAPPFLRVPELLVRGAIRALRPVARIARRELPIDESGVDFFTFDRHFSWQRAKRELGYCPRVELQTGVPRAVAWYREHRLL